MEYLDYYPEEKNNLIPLLNQLEDSSNIFDRKTRPAHITTSAIVIENNHLLTIFHPFFKKWFQPGGHLEIGETPLEASMRELLEETGLHSSIHFWHDRYQFPFDIDVQFIPANTEKGELEHIHYDFRYLLKIKERTLSSLQHDHEIAWINCSTLEEENLIRLHKKILLPQ